MEAKLNELTKIVELKKAQADTRSLDEARHIESLIDEALKAARATLTEYGKELLSRN